MLKLKIDIKESNTFFPAIVIRNICYANISNKN